MKQTKYRELTKLFSNKRPKQIELFILCTISVCLSLYFAYMIQDVVDMVIAGTEKEKILSSFLYILVIGMVSFFFSVLQTKKWHCFRYELMNQMRIMMYDKMIEKNMKFFDNRTTGDITAAIMNDGSLIAESAGVNHLMFFLNVLQIVIILTVLLLKNTIMGMIEIFLAAIYFICVNIINKKMRDRYKEFSQETSNLNQRIVEDTKAIYEIKTLNEVDFFKEKMRTQVWKRFYPATQKVVGVEVTSYAVNEFINIIFPMVMLLIGSIFSYQGVLTIGAVILFYTYTQKIVEPLNNLSDFYRGTQMAVGAADRIYDYLFSEEEKKQEELPSEMKDVRLNMDIRSFSWDGERKIFENIHEKIERGDMVYIQGESGAGKTTLLKLICGLYPISDGEILINGKDVSFIKEKSLFSHIKVQFQESIILEGTIQENIELGEKFSEEQLREAVALANLSEFVEEKGFDYYIAESGKNLSGGQKQRLALARIFIRKPDILILDEATSALDIENEVQIVEKIEEFVRKNNCILFVTSHRDNLRKICNKVIRV